MGVRVGGDSRVSSVKDLERAFAHGGMDAVVVLKGTYGEPIGPVVLMMVKDNAEILFNFLIDTFHLSISLWVKGSRGVCLDVKHLVEVV